MKTFIKLFILTISLSAIAQSFASTKIFNFEISNKDVNSSEGGKESISGKEPGV